MEVSCLVLGEGFLQLLVPSDGSQLLLCGQESDGVAEGSSGLRLPRSCASQAGTGKVARTVRRRNCRKDRLRLMRIVLPIKLFCAILFFFFLTPALVSCGNCLY